MLRTWNRAAITAASLLTTAATATAITYHTTAIPSTFSSSASYSRRSWFLPTVHAAAATSDKDSLRTTTSTVSPAVASSSSFALSASSSTLSAFTASDTSLAAPVLALQTGHQSGSLLLSSAPPSALTPPGGASNFATVSPSQFDKNAAAIEVATTVMKNPGAGLSDAELKTCEEYKHKAIHSSRKVNYLLRALSKNGCQVDPFTFIQCIKGHPSSSGGTIFSDQGLMIVMCGNTSRSFDHFETVLSHELIHAFDHCRAEVDTNNLQHHACTEVRAANLSGDCTFMRQLKVGGTVAGFTNQHKRCVHRLAVTSVLVNPKITSYDQAKAVVDQVFDRCITDTEPFGSVPW